MDTFIETYNPFPVLSSEDVPLAYFLTSNCSRSTLLNAAVEAEVMLASRNPKKKAGRKKFRETRHPVYRGVRMRDNGKWVCEVREPNNKKLRVWLGTHPTAIMAARAHDVAAFAFRGRSACLNFADSVWRLPVPKSSKVQDIQKAAAEAAEAFRYTDDEIEIEETEELPESQLYVNEEDIFEMPGIFASMAEGLMIVPPPQNVGYDNYGDNMEFCGEASLWSF
uniref:DREB1B n=1 Tax=Cichorium intybus TaxID=13427 RepID=W6AP54_CICIN|nr:DREB1B [Cichorium intybus]